MTRHPDGLLPLFHHRWAVPILAELERTAGSKFITLAYRLGIPRDSVQRTLTALVDAGLVRRNPGYGHPLRPEYIPSHRGSRVGRSSIPLMELLQRLQIEDVGLKKWSMPLLDALRRGPRRFSELKAEFPGLTARSLALALKDLETASLVERRVVETYPPSALYRLTPNGRRLATVLRRMSVALVR